MTTKDHQKLLGIFFFVHAGLQLVGGVLVTLIYGGMGLFALTNSRRQDDQMFGGILIAVALIAAVFVIAFAFIQLMAGWRLTKAKAGGRTWGIVASVISLLGFPLGTALGVYGLWFLFGDLGKNLESRTSEHAAPAYPPPPNSWQ